MTIFVLMFCPSVVSFLTLSELVCLFAERGEVEQLGLESLVLLVHLPHFSMLLQVRSEEEDSQCLHFVSLSDGLP